MPTLKHIPIHTGVLDFLRYIEDAFKTEGQRLITGMNCPTEIPEAYKSFRRTYEHFSNMPYIFNRVTREKDENGYKANRDKIIMHHYVQSFDPKEKLSTEEANAIGVEWAKKVFGDNFQIIVSTHVDKEHIHNHIAVCPYSLDGKKWNSNKKTLRNARRISDEIALAHGLSIIENPKTKNHMKYKEWLERQNGTSWKMQLCQKIDKLIMQDNVHSLEDLQKELQKEKYYVRLGKYMTIKPPDKSRGIRTENLDKMYGGYSMSELEYRIRHKEKEISWAAISKLSGEQKYYAVYMRSMQITVFHQNKQKPKSKNATYRELVRNAELLNYLVLNNIHSAESFSQKADDISNEYSDLKKSERAMKKRLEYLESSFTCESHEIISELKSDIEKVQEKLKTSEKEKKEVERFWNQYISDKQSDEYNRALDEYRRIREDLEKDNERQIKSERT